MTEVIIASRQSGKTYNAIEQFLYHFPNAIYYVNNKREKDYILNHLSSSKFFDKLYECYGERITSHIEVLSENVLRRDLYRKNPYNRRDYIIYDEPNDDNIGDIKNYDMGSLYNYFDYVCGSPGSSYFLNTLYNNKDRFKIEDNLRLILDEK